MYEDALELLRKSHDPELGPIVGASEAELVSLEARVGLPLPEGLKSWLRVCKSSTGGEGGVFGISERVALLNIDALLDLSPNWRGFGWIPIAGDGCGNYYVMLRHGDREVIAFVEAVVEEDEIAYITATTLETFLREMLLDEERATGWPFDRNYVETVDPDLLGISPNPFDVD